MKKFDLAVREAEAESRMSKQNRLDFPVDRRDVYVYVLAMSGKISQAEAVAAALKRDIKPGDDVPMRGYWRAAGAIELAKANPSSAVAHLEKALARRGLGGAATGDNSWRVLLAEAYLDVDRRGEAVGVLEREISSYGPFDPILAVKAHYFLGLAYEKSGWREKAIQQYQEFLEIWKDADPGIAEVGDARTRLARLKSVA
jgi:tetratricopeptide (TPR) repeat protein